MFLIGLDRFETPLGPLTKAKNVQDRERLNGELLLSFELPLCDERQYLELEGYVNHEGQLYVIKNIEEVGDTSNSVSVQCTHVYIEAVDEYIDRTVDLLGVTCEQAVAQVLQGTPFTVGIINAPGLHDMDLSEMSLLKALQDIREKWNVDLWFDNRTVYLGTLGHNNGEQIRYGMNLKSLRKPTTSTNVITRLYVYGKDGLTIEAVNGGQKYLDSPNVGLYRRPKVGTVRFNDIDDPHELMEEGQRHLLKNDKVSVSYSTDFIELGKYELGDIVTITHVPFNIQTIGTRVVELIRYPYESRPSTAVLSSFIETTIDDLVKIRRRQYAFERYSTGRDAELKQGITETGEVAAAEALLAETRAKAYADGIVSAEEERAILDAETKLSEAKADATAKMEQAKADAAAAQATANSAQSAASNAQADANTANSKLADISSDSKLTPLEKQATKKEWDAIVVERPTIEEQADVYGIITAKTAYTAAYTTLNTYVNPLLADLSATSDITGSTFRATFRDYYDKKTLLLKAIADKAKEFSAQAEASAKTYADTNYSGTKTKVENGDLVVKDKYGQLIVDAEGLRLDSVAGFGIQKGGIIRLENRSHAQTKTTTTAYTAMAAGTINVGNTDGFPSSGTAYINSNPSEFLDSFTYTGKTATSFTGVSGVERNYNSGSSVFLWTQPVADVVVSAMEVYTPGGKFFTIPETWFNGRTLGAGAGDFDGWEFRYLYVDANGVIQYVNAGTSGGLSQYPPNPPAGSVRLGYLLVGYGIEQPDGTLEGNKEWDNSGYPVFKERIYLDPRYRDERAIRADGGEALLGGVPYGSQTLAVTTNPGEYKTYYIQVGKGKRSVNASLTLDDGSGYDNVLYGASLVVGRKAANNADGQGRPLWANYRDADGTAGHVTGQRNLSPYGVHVLSPRVWNKSYTMLYDADLMPSPTDGSVIVLKLTFRNYGGVSESFNLKVNWHAL